MIKNHKEDDHCNEIHAFGDIDVEPSNLTESFPPIPDSSEPSIASQTPFSGFLGTTLPIDIDSIPSFELGGDTEKPSRIIEDKERNKQADIHKPNRVEQSVQQNDQAFSDVVACKEAISQLKNELKMISESIEVIEDSIKDVETLLPLQELLDSLNQMYLSMRDVKKKAESISSVPTRKSEIIIECSVCYKEYLGMCKFIHERIE